MNNENRYSFSIVLFSAIAIFSVPMLAVAALPANVEKDRLFLGLSDAIKGEDYKSALTYIEKLEALEGVELPNGYYYYKAETLYENKKYDSALRAVAEYLNKVNTGGRFYEKAIALYNRAENKAAESRKQTVNDLISQLEFRRTFSHKEYDENSRTKAYRRISYERGYKSSAKIDPDNLCLILVSQTVRDEPNDYWEGDGDSSPIYGNDGYSRSKTFERTIDATNDYSTSLKKLAKKESGYSLKTDQWIIKIPGYAFHTGVAVESRESGARLITLLNMYSKFCRENQQ